MMLISFVRIYYDQKYIKLYKNLLEYIFSTINMF